MTQALSEDELLELPREQVERFEEVELTPEEENKFADLLTLGKITREIRFFGHTAIISTLTNEEEIELGMVMHPYKEIYTVSRAYRTAVVAAGLKELDGDPLYIPLHKVNEFERIKGKFNILKNYYPTVIDYLYGQIQELDNENKDIWSKLGKGSS